MDIAVLFHLEALSGRRKQQGILPINLLSKLTKQKSYRFNVRTQCVSTRSRLTSLRKTSTLS